MITVCTINEETFEIDEVDFFDVEYGMLVFKNFDDESTPVAAFPERNVVAVIFGDIDNG